MQQQDTANCLHVQPSSDVVSHAHDVTVIPEAAIVTFLEPVSANPTWPPADPHEGFSRESRGRPLFILHSALLI